LLYTWSNLFDFEKKLYILTYFEMEVVRKM
jgi:hypothetical protein